MRRLLFLTILCVSSLVSRGCDQLSSADPTNRPKRPPRLHGGGSNFVNPLMQKWCGDYARLTGTKVNYQSVGSGRGIQHMTIKTFDFGGSDAPMNEDQLKKARDVGGAVQHIPLCMGAVVLAYNLPEVERPIRFTPNVLAGIFLGKITKWNAPELRALNPEVAFPDQEIVVVHRSDASGTTYIWTEYLSKVSPEWKKQHGFGTEIKKWPCGVGQKGNEGVSAHVARTPAAVGYTELTYALQNQLRTGIVQNREGTFVRPSLESVTAAAAGTLSEIPDDLRYSLTNPLGKDAYPICGTVYALVYVNQHGDKGEALVNFLRWATHEGQQSCEELQYARLPPGLVARVETKLEQIHVGK